MRVWPRFLISPLQSLKRRVTDVRLYSQGGRQAEECSAPCMQLANPFFAQTTLLKPYGLWVRPYFCRWRPYGFPATAAPAAGAAAAGAAGGATGAGAANGASAFATFSFCVFRALRISRTWFQKADPPAVRNPMIRYPVSCRSGDTSHFAAGIAAIWPLAEYAAMVPKT